MFCGWGVKASMVPFAGKTVWSMCDPCLSALEVLTMKRYTNWRILYKDVFWHQKSHQNSNGVIPSFSRFLTFYPFADKNSTVSSYFIIERGFFLVGVYKQKGLGIWGHKRKKETIELRVWLFLGRVYSQTVVEHITRRPYLKHAGTTPGQYYRQRSTPGQPL